MQTIARANRVFPDKNNGLIVDYAGIFNSLEKALSIYGDPGQGGHDSPIKNKDELSLKGSVLICNPVPKKYSIPNNIIEKAINSSMLKARQNKIHGKKLTPFLLEKVSSITKGKTLETNIQLMLNNAKLAARIAFALNK